MSLLLVAVIVSGVVIGYWLVSVFLSSSEPMPEPTQDAVNGAPRHWTDVLGVPKNAQPTEISAAYRNALTQQRQHDRDDVAPELRAIAQQRITEIEAAYLAAIRERQR